MPDANVVPLAIKDIEVMAEVLRHNWTPVLMLPEPLKSAAIVFKMVLLVEPAYEKKSAVIIVGVLVLVLSCKVRAKKVLFE